LRYTVNKPNITGLQNLVARDKV